jgi:hypothetical protein
MTRAVNVSSRVAGFPHTQQPGGHFASKTRTPSFLVMTISVNALFKSNEISLKRGACISGHGIGAPYMGIAVFAAKLFTGWGASFPQGFVAFP